MKTTFTEGLINYLTHTPTPVEKGDSAKETALLIIASDDYPYMCASFGSSKKVIAALMASMEQSLSISDAILLSAGAYMAKHMNDHRVKTILSEIITHKN